MIDEKRKAQAQAYRRKWWAEHPDKAEEYRSRRKEKRKLERKRGAESVFAAKPKGGRPEGCVWPDCFHCPFEDCVVW